MSVAWPPPTGSARPRSPGASRGGCHRHPSAACLPTRVAEVMRADPEPRAGRQGDAAPDQPPGRLPREGVSPLTGRPLTESVAPCDDLAGTDGHAGCGPNTP